MKDKVKAEIAEHQNNVFAIWNRKMYDLKHRNIRADKWLEEYKKSAK